MSESQERVDLETFRLAADDYIREVRETGAEIVITVDGEPVAVVRPFTAHDDAAERKRANDEVWARLEESRQEIGKAWPPGLSAVDAVSEQRR